MKFIEVIPNNLSVSLSSKLVQQYTLIEKDIPKQFSNIKQTLYFLVFLYPNAVSLSLPLSQRNDIEQCFYTGVLWATSKFTNNLFVFTFTILLGERWHLGCNKVVLLGLFWKILGISVQLNFF